MQTATPMSLTMWSTVICIAMSAATGCNESDPLTAVTVSRLKDIATVYLDYAAAKGAGPLSVNQLHQHMQNTAGFKLSTRPHENGDTAIFKSARDGQPFVIRYGVNVCQDPGSTAPPIAFEREGRDGTRYVALANGEVTSIAEEVASELTLCKR